MSKILEETAELEQKNEPISGTRNSLIAENNERIVSGFKPAAELEQKSEPVSGTRNSLIAENNGRIVSGDSPAAELEQKNEPVSGIEDYPSQAQGAKRVQLQAAVSDDSPALLAYEEVAPKPQTELHVKLVKRKSRKGFLIAFIALIVVAGLGITAYSLGVTGGTGIESITGAPEGASVPAFSPIDPADFAADADDNFIVVPDETGLELPTFGHGPQLSAEPQNHYTQTPNVSTAFTRAAQDESYVYFLQGPAATKYGLYKLMRANPSTGKAGLIANANETDSSIYSFVLYGQNIITCEYKASTDSFAFYRVPKSGEDAQLLFETDSPAYMNVFDNKLFMLFVEEQSLGVFDLKTDTQPAHIALAPTEETAHYFPQFSIVDGYLYYGIWHETDMGAEDNADGEAEDDTDGNTLVSMEYLRRSMYTGEIVSLLHCESGDAIWNPCWDDNNNAYYTGYDDQTMEFNLVTGKDSGSPQTISVVERSSDGSWPIVAFKDEFLVVSQAPDILRQYGRTGFSVNLEASAESLPFAVTKDFLVTDDGMYRLFDFGFVAFEPA